MIPNPACNADEDSPRSGEGGIRPWVKREGLALLVDLYELTMLAGYQAGGRTEQRACFEYSFRELPADNGFAVSAGLEQLLDYLEGLRFEGQDLDYLETLKSDDPSPEGKPDETS